MRADGGAERGWARLGRAVRERREELGLTQADVAAAGGPSPATQYLIESGARDSYRPRLLRGLERAMGWAAYSTARVLAGGEPEVVGEPPPAVPPPRPASPGAGVPAQPGVSAWVEGFQLLPLSPRERVEVLVRLLGETAATLEDAAPRP